MAPVATLRTKNEGNRQDSRESSHRQGRLLLRILPAEDGRWRRELVRADGPHGGPQPGILRHHVGGGWLHGRSHARHREQDAEHDMRRDDDAFDVHEHARREDRSRSSDY